MMSVVFRVRPLSDGSNPWSTSLVKSQKSVPLAALFAEQGELKIHCDAVYFKMCICVFIYVKHICFIFN